MTHCAPGSLCGVDDPLWLPYDLLLGDTGILGSAGIWVLASGVLVVDLWSPWRPVWR